jgi:soluble lytic murein transglycosylase-like protein
MDLETNIYYGVKYLAACQKKYGNNPKEIACCYNAGMFRDDNVCTSNQVKKYQRKVLGHMYINKKIRSIL